jgi:hypothetical protein
MMWRYSKNGLVAIRRAAWGALALSGVICVFSLSASDPVDPSDPLDVVQQKRLSGAERSAVALQEIKAVLERMDSRLQRIEAALNRDAAATSTLPVNPAATLEFRRGNGR